MVDQDDYGHFAHFSPKHAQARLIIRLEAWANY